MKASRDEHRLLVTSLLGRPLTKCIAEDRAITVEPVYFGEVFTNTRGGIRTSGATQYEGLLDLLFTVDLEQTRMPLPGRFVFLAQNTHGRGLTEDFIGDTQVISNIDSGDNISQISEYWWELGLLDDDVTLRLGKQDVNTEFLLVEMAEDFIQSSFGLSPSSAGLPTYPDPSMAAVLLSQLTDRTRLKLGIWDGLASGGSWGFSGNDVILLIGELEHKYSLYGGRLPGVFELGLAYNSDGFVDGELFPSEWGYYLQWEQLVCRERPCDPEDSQGLGYLRAVFSAIWRRTGHGVSAGSNRRQRGGGCCLPRLIAWSRRRRDRRGHRLGSTEPRWHEPGNRGGNVLQSAGDALGQPAAGPPVHRQPIRNLPRLARRRSSVRGGPVIPPHV